MSAMGCHTFAIHSPLCQQKDLGLVRRLRVPWKTYFHAPRLRFTKTRAQAAASSTARKQETTENWDKERMAQNLQITCELREHCICCLQDLVGQSRVLLITLKESEGTRALSKTRFISFSRRLATAEPWLGGSQQII